MRINDKKRRGEMSVRQSGVALAMLVWFIAALSILVAGIVYQARIDIKLAQLQIGQAQAQAAGDGAIHLALADMMTSEQEINFKHRGIQTGSFELGDAQVRVNIVPVSGLVNVNLASQELLADLLAYGAELDEADSQSLALKVVQWRTSEIGGAAFDSVDTVSQEDIDGGLGPERAGRGQDSRGLPGTGSRQFEAIEDLLRVEGINRDIYESIRDSVYVASQGQAGVDWLAAPIEVLLVLTAGDRESTMELAGSRILDDDAYGTPPAEMNAGFQEAQIFPLYRVDALVKVGDVNYQRRRWAHRDQPGSDGLPWSFFRTEPVRGLNAKEREMLAFVESVYVGE